MTVSQPVMLIAGMPEDPVFVHVCYVATHLSQMLVNFQIEKICKQREEWEPWLKELCGAHNWSHETSPLVWREVGVRGGKATYVGGATQFWEFIQEYYGIESRLTRDELKSLEQDFSQEFEVEARINASKATQRKLNIAILGGDESLCEHLVAELLLIKQLSSGHGIAVRLYNARPNDQIRDIVESSKGLHAATVVQTIGAVLVNCDILIILDEILRENEEGTDNWLNRNRAMMLELAVQINDFAPDRMKVIFCSAGPNCFNAGVLEAEAKKLNAHDIVVVGAHEGLKILHELLSSANLSSEEIGCPPVWGFLGINHFVDICNAVQRHEIYRPNERALKPHEGTTLPLGIRQPELRSIFYAMHDKNPRIGINERKVDEIQKCKAICDLLSLWYEENCKIDGEITSLGIRSDGTFGIPKGIYFSQPVYMKEQEDGFRAWIPCSGFPIPNHPNWILKNLIETAEILVKRHPYRNMPSTISSIKSETNVLMY